MPVLHSVLCSEHLGFHFKGGSICKGDLRRLKWNKICGLIILSPHLQHFIVSINQPVIGFMAQLGTSQQSQVVCLRNYTSHFLHLTLKLTSSLEKAFYTGFFPACLDILIFFISIVWARNTKKHECPGEHYSLGGVPRGKVKWNDIVKTWHNKQKRTLRASVARESPRGKVAF